MTPIETITVGPDGSGDAMQVVVWLIDRPGGHCVRPGGTVEMYPDWVIVSMPGPAEDVPGAVVWYPRDRVARVDVERRSPTLETSEVSY